MGRSLKERLCAQAGAAVIETLGAMFVFLAALLTATFMGISYYNANVLNSSAQNITLNTQVQLDRWCSPQQQGECSRGQLAAETIRADILNQTAGELAFVDTGTLAADARVYPPSENPVPWPAGYSDLAATPGWGYNTVQLSVQQKLFGGSNGLVDTAFEPLTLRASSMTTSYKEPTR